MTKISALAFTLALSCIPLASSAALAAGSQPFAFVGSLGNNSGGCGAATSPCRTFQFVHDNIVAPGGSIYVHDAGSYGPITITHALSIINDSAGDAAIYAASGDAIDIQAGQNDAVFLKGLVVDGGGSGANGIKLTSGASLTIANCTIKGFAATALSTGAGVQVIPASGTTQVNVYNSTISNNRQWGLLLSPQGPSTPASYGASKGAGSVVAHLKNVDISASFYDLYVSNHYTTGAVTVTIDDSSFTSGTYGITANGGTVVANRTVVSNNLEGLYAGGSAAIYLSNATISGNQTAFGNFATIYSYRNNIIRGNTSGSDSNGHSLTYLSAAD
ncbi:right-handed parallel beta-helix repeat-containing protein [Methylosinus sp. LW4]|uniref:right-handed parallel beta-helix repeat-containing protein n=1 Tax=Methylosinus sp. LW4 TaxID=136993 RepID=UPI00035F4849|nr:right-handed parallel beta-helix repeat-containing protein [Methylosinus sp. LW4]